jgi:hypothetical protein
LSVLEFALFGFGTIAYVKHPEGVLEFQKRSSIRKLNQLRGRLTRKDAAPDPGGPAPGMGGEVVGFSGTGDVSD